VSPPPPASTSAPPRRFEVAQPSVVPPSSSSSYSSSSSSSTSSYSTSSAPPSSYFRAPEDLPEHISTRLASELEKPAFSGGTTQYQVDLIRSVVQDSLISFQLEVHTAIQDMQVEMMRQFEIQRRELRQLLQQGTPTEDLMAELRRLREENERLRFDS